MIPVQATHDVLNILPGVFIIGGIFGTFLGIMGALPELGEMKLEDVEGAKMIMDNFLTKISFSMSTSIIGIIVSVCMTFINTLLDPEKLYVKTVNKFENTMELAWDVSVNNLHPRDIKDFDEHRDPIEALAEDAVENEVLGANVISTDEPVKETLIPKPVSETIVEAQTQNSEEVDKAS